MIDWVIFGTQIDVNLRKTTKRYFQAQRLNISRYYEKPYRKNQVPAKSTIGLGAN